MNDNQLNIGKNIRAIRLKLSMTQQQLADECGLSKGMISKVENGVVVPAVATLTKIAQVMHVKV
ncbi:MAG: helix-turn-helix transcriptional regulator, partial [Clostridia bacterium]